MKFPTKWPSLDRKPEEVLGACVRYEDENFYSKNHVYALDKVKSQIPGLQAGKRAGKRLAHDGGENSGRRGSAGNRAVARAKRGRGHSAHARSRKYVIQSKERINTVTSTYLRRQAPGLPKARVHSPISWRVSAIISSSCFLVSSLSAIKS